MSKGGGHVSAIAASDAPETHRPDYEQFGWGIGEQHQMVKRLARIIVHHEGSTTAAGSSALAIHRYHRSLGWAAVGYHFIIERDGTVNEGRPLWAIGAHTKGFNDDSWGVCLVGNLDMEPPTPEQVQSLTTLLQWLKSQQPNIGVIGHGELMATDCPGKYLNLAAIRANLH